MVRYYIVFQGRVQGVGFRYFCQFTATTLSLTGYARNMDNGMVEVEIQGDSEKVSKFITSISKGNRFVRVDDYNIKKIEVTDNETSFKIKY